MARRAADTTATALLERAAHLLGGTPRAGFRPQVLRTAANDLARARQRHIQHIHNLEQAEHQLRQHAAKVEAAEADKRLEERVIKRSRRRLRRTGEQLAVRGFGSQCET